MAPWKKISPRNDAQHTGLRDCGRIVIVAIGAAAINDIIPFRRATVANFKPITH